MKNLRQFISESIVNEHAVKFEIKYIVPDTGEEKKRYAYSSKWYLDIEQLEKMYPGLENWTVYNFDLLGGYAPQLIVAWHGEESRAAQVIASGKLHGRTLAVLKRKEVTGSAKSFFDNH